MYAQHASQALNQAFSRTPFQGVRPEAATYLFIGLDANYGPAIEQSPVFPQLLDYLQDGVGFWNRHRVHHPFLLPAYKRSDGWKYHQTFSTIGFRPEQAHQVSFIELLHVPTFGRSQLGRHDLDDKHLRRVNDAIQYGAARHVFICDSVARLMRASAVFNWMPSQPRDTGGPLKLWCKTDTRHIHWHYHFSVYGKFEQKKQEQLSAIRHIVNAGVP